MGWLSNSFECKLNEKLEVCKAEIAAAEKRAAEELEERRIARESRTWVLVTRVSYLFCHLFRAKTTHDERTNKWKAGTHLETIRYLTYEKCWNMNKKHSASENDERVAVTGPDRSRHIIASAVTHNNVKIGNWLSKEKHTFIQLSAWKNQQKFVNQFEYR